MIHDEKGLELLARTNRNREIVQRFSPCPDPQHNPTHSGAPGSYSHYCPSCGKHGIYHVRSRPSL